MVTFLPFRAYNTDNQLIIDTWVVKESKKSPFQTKPKILEEMLFLNVTVLLIYSYMENMSGKHTNVMYIFLLA